MYKKFVILICFSTVLFSIVPITCNSHQEIEYSLNISHGDIADIEVNAEGPSYLDHQRYNYMTSSHNEILYLLNYLNCFNLIDDGETVTANDVSSYLIKLHLTDDSTEEYRISVGRFYDYTGKQYAIDNREFKRFLDFINALKTEKVILEDEVTFEPSKWANDKVVQAIDSGLVPGLNQINYTGKINRLETCQLVDNLLKKQNIVEENSKEKPFSDTSDSSIINLYRHGVIHGKSENEFLPYDYVTREELAKILSNTYYLVNEKAQANDIMHEYVDQEEIEDWALGYVNDIYALDIMIGNSDNEFRAKDNVTKEEVIITILRIFK